MPSTGNAIITGLSTRGEADYGKNALIAGFTISGTTAKTLLIRGVVKLLNVMKFATFARKTQSFLGRAARIAKRRGLDLAFTFRDLGDAYHVYGVSLTPAKFVQVLEIKHAARRGA